MEHQEMETRRPNFKVAHNVHVGVLMAPMEVARATRDREGGLYRGLLRWTLCGEVSPAMFDVLQATEMRLGRNERITAFAGPSGLNYALFTHQMAMFQHRYLVPLYDGQVAQCMDEVGRLGGLGYSLAGESDHALVWPNGVWHRSSQLQQEARAVGLEGDFSCTGGGGLADELDDAANELIWLALRNITADWGRSTKDCNEAMVRDPSPDAVIRQGPRRLRRRHSLRPPPPRAGRSCGPVTV